MTKILALVAVLLTLTIAPAVADSRPKWQTTPCKFEDSNNCYWDADVRGNGEGHSFYAIPSKGKRCVIYWDRAFGAKHNRCYR